jgi:hypothetical protein
MMPQEKTRRLRITFIIPFAGKTGGTMVVLEYLRQLRRLGHDVEIYYPLFPYWSLTNGTERGSLAWRLLVHAVWFIQNLQKMTRSVLLFNDPVPVRPVPWIGGLFVGNADIVVATAWCTANSVFRLPRKKGKKYYLVQDIETWGNNHDAVIKTYSLGLTIITVSRWLTEKLHSQFSCRVAAEIPNGCNHSLFYPPPHKNLSLPSILMMYSPFHHKGSADGLAALSLLKKQFSDVPVLLFGHTEKPTVDFKCRYLRDPSHADLLSAYQGSAIFVFPSLYEGWGLPVVEAMACGCAVVATRAGCVDMLYNGKNALVVRPGCPRSLYRGLVLLVKSEERRRLLSGEGIKTAATFSWERSAGKLASFFAGASAPA